MGRALRPGGTAIFTVESIPSPTTATFELQANGRYRHAEHYVRIASEAGGLSVEQVLPATLRLEAGEEVHGSVVTLRKAA